MIGVVFQFAGEIVEVRVHGNNVFFRAASQGGQWATIDGLKLDYRGVIKEHPDLKGISDWREQAIMRFKKKIQSLETETQKINYVIADLKEHGYIPRYKQRQGYRPEKI